MHNIVMVNFLNFLFFQLNWFACAYSASYQKPILGISCVICTTIVYITYSKIKRFDCLFFAFLGLLGFLIDTFFIQINAIQMIPVTSVSPAFMVALWVNFVSTFKFSLSWIHKHSNWALIFAFFGAPLSYYAGAKIGALSLNPSLFYSLSTIGIIWVPAMFLLIKTYKKWGVYE